MKEKKFINSYQKLHFLPMNLIKRKMKNLTKLLAKKVNFFLFYLKHPKTILQSIALQQYLDETGWYKSRDAKKPLNKNKEPIPWWTYSSIYFLDKRIKKGMNIFEFGSGNSTLWFASKGCFLNTYEHNLNWYNYLKDKLPSNVNYNYCPLEKNGDYCKSITRQNNKFDIVIVDGRDRVNCMLNSINYLTEKGVLICDNSDRNYYEVGFKYLKRNGFKRLEFYGHSPINIKSTETSIFYREKNCLDI